MRKVSLRCQKTVLQSNEKLQRFNFCFVLIPKKEGLKTRHEYSKWRGYLDLHIPALPCFCLPKLSKRYLLLAFLLVVEQLKSGKDIYLSDARNSKQLQSFCRRKKKLLISRKATSNFFVLILVSRLTVWQSWPPLDPLYKDNSNGYYITVKTETIRDI